MKERTALSFLIDARNCVRGARGSLWQFLRRSPHDSIAYQDAEEAFKVLDAVYEQLAKTVRREHHSDPNYRNMRQAEDFALKAQLARVRSAVGKAVNALQDRHSDK